MDTDKKKFPVHKGALQNEIVKLLAFNNGDIVVDATLGLGSHSKLILDNILPSGKLIGIDWDPVCLHISKQYLVGFTKHVIFVNDNFSNIENILKNLNIKYVDKIIADLGVSSYHLDSGERGFSFRATSFLDMRFNPRDISLTAEYIINNFPKERLAEIFKEFGGEKRARYLASLIVYHRNKKKINTAVELADIVKRAYPRGRKRIHPATKVFQALRIFVNKELDNLKLFLEKAPRLLRAGGKLAVISYHSLEDRLVKTYFKQLKDTGNFNILTSKPVVPKWSEVKENPRVRSAKLRCIQKMAEQKNKRI